MSKGLSLPFGLTKYDTLEHEMLAFGESRQYLSASQAQQGGELFSERGLHG